VSRSREKLFDRIVLVAAGIAILLVVGGLIWYGMTSGGGPADLEPTIVDTGRTEGDERVYQVTISNKGGTTAEDLVVEVMLGDESREVQIRFVTKGDQEEVFVSIPGSGTPEVRVVSYTEH
jgi:uncharacterized protein (TIGR02588 family)